MALWNSRPKKEKQSVALIDIGFTSVGVGLAHVQAGEPPTLYYTLRKDISPHEQEESHMAMLRTLTDVTETLVTRGAPVLRKEVGSGHIDQIIVSIGSPWQKTIVRTEQLTPSKPFVFTHAILAEALAKNPANMEGYIKSHESVLSILLNGYETDKPFGKKANRATLISLSSFVEKNITNAVEQVLRKTYHTHALTITAFAPVAYSVLREVYPHEKDFLVLQVCGETTDIAFVKRGNLVSVSTIPHGTNDLIRGSSAAAQIPHEEAWDPHNIIDQTKNSEFEKNIQEIQTQWVSLLSSTFTEFASKNALPRTIFLLADTDARDYLKNLLDATSLRSLWLSEESLRIVPITAALFSSVVQSRAEAEGDIFLSFLSIYARARAS